MTSYLNSLTSHYTSLKRLLPNSLSADSDLHISDPEDSHVSRVLRAYYTEKGRPFPPWLGPDPNAPVPTKAAFVQAPVNNYGNPAAPVPSLRNSRGQAAGGGLNDLFGDNAAPAPPPREEPLSLRSRRRLQPAAPEPQASARPLPSQRVGSYQQRGAPGADFAGPERPQPSREQSAQARLKARLGGARSNSPVPGSQGASGVRAGQSPDPYGRSAGGGGGGGAGGYNAYGGGGGGGGNPYGGSSGSGNPYGGASSNPYGDGGGYGGGSQPLTSANAPWSGGDDGYSGGGGYGGDSGGRRGQGLPLNPRRR